MAIKVEVAYGERRIACTFDTEPVKFQLSWNTN